MARRVFFSFHYQRDLWRVNQIRNSHVVVGTAAAGFQDASLWEATRKKGDRAIKALIDKGLKGTSVTVVLIGSETANRRYIEYEIEKSVEVGNGLLGVYIHNLKDRDGKTCPKGAVPAGLVKRNIPVYEWDREKFGDWVEGAARRRPLAPIKADYWSELAPIFAFGLFVLLLWFINRRGQGGDGPDRGSGVDWY